MEINIFLFCTIFLYSIIVSQSFSYIISLRNVQLHMTAPVYIVFRKLTDTNFRLKYRFVIYAALLSNLLLTIASAIHSSDLLFVTSAIAFIALITDTVIAIKGNVPINDIINSWTPEKYPPNWASYRNEWLAVFSKRQAANITGFASLLTGAIFS